MNYINLSRIYLEMISRFNVATFDVISVMDETDYKPSQTLITYYYDERIPVDVPKLKMFLKRHIRFVDQYFVEVEDGKIMICIIFKQKMHTVDYGFEFSLN